MEANFALEIPFLENRLWQRTVETHLHYRANIIGPNI